MRFLCLENATLLVRKIQLATSLYDEEDRDMNGGYGPLQSNPLPPKKQQKTPTLSEICPFLLVAIKTSTH